MTTTALALALTPAFVLLSLVINHCYARLALVELTLNEGLPPGYENLSRATTAAVTPIGSPAKYLDTGVHIFLSRNCHACQRLVDELDQTALTIAQDLHLRYVDRPRPIARTVAANRLAQLHEQQSELAAMVGADPLPYTIAIGQHGLVSTAVTPTVAQLLHATRDAGIDAAFEASST